MDLSSIKTSLFILFGSYIFGAIRTYRLAINNTSTLDLSIHKIRLRST
uniref:Uncharacterized protein n=1 Tax=Picea glauca TaxID=3330 RepID=A0A117NI13_PICGL|nr:hypothetical protein ABT39_MTgene3739 [Picea glauca]QHR87377.1 hypothetical protein Q903MT_gene1387 [Picea sitchensis]